MRIAVVSDVHANLSALEAVTADLRDTAPDVVVHGGDLVGSGPRPAEVIDHIRTAGWDGVRGNTDEMLANSGAVSLSYDGDPRASYALITDQTLEIRRVEYDPSEEIRLLIESNDPFAPSIAETLRTGRDAPITRPGR